MTVIRIDTAEVSRISSDFSKKAGEIDALIKQARAAMNNLRSGFTGNRAKQAFGQWDSMQNGLDQANLNLQEAAKTLGDAVKAFSSADGS